MTTKELASWLDATMKEVFGEGLYERMIKLGLK